MFEQTLSLFDGIPIVESPLAVEVVYREKKWKRLNRPPKIKTKKIEIPMAYKTGFFGLGRLKIIAHPKIVARLKEMKP